jgi:hypothetical protein
MIYQSFNPQLNSHKSPSCTTSAYLGTTRGLSKSLKAYQVKIRTVEVLSAHELSFNVSSS